MSRHEYVGTKNIIVKSKLGDSTARPAGKSLNEKPGSNTHAKHVFTVKPFDASNKIVEHHIYEHGGKLAKPEYKHQFTHVMSNKNVEALLKHTKPHGQPSAAKIEKAEESVQLNQVKFTPSELGNARRRKDIENALCGDAAAGSAKRKAAQAFLERLASRHEAAKTKPSVNQDPELLTKAPIGGVCLDHAYLTPGKWKRFSEKLRTLEDAIGLTRIGYTVTESGHGVNLKSFNMYYKRMSQSKENAFRLAVRQLWSKSPGQIAMK
jgi:hypothetical protein